MKNPAILCFHESAKHSPASAADALLASLLLLPPPRKRGNRLHFSSWSAVPAGVDSPWEIFDARDQGSHDGVEEVVVDAGVEEDEVVLGAGAEVPNQLDEDELVLDDAEAACEGAVDKEDRFRESKRANEAEALMKEKKKWVGRGGM